MKKFKTIALIGLEFLIRFITKLFKNKAKLQVIQEINAYGEKLKKKIAERRAEINAKYDRPDDV